MNPIQEFLSKIKESVPEDLLELYDRAKEFSDENFGAEGYVDLDFELDPDLCDFLLIKSSMDRVTPNYLITQAIKKVIKEESDKNSLTFDG